MKKSKFSEDQIAFALKQAELGATVDEVCGKMGISEATFYLWRKKYQNLGPPEVRRLRQLEEENRKLKQIVADLSLDKAMLQAIVQKNVWSAPRLQALNVDEDSLHKCIRPLASELRLQPGHDEIRAQRS